MTAMIYVLFDLHLNSACFLPTRLLSEARLLDGWRRRVTSGRRVAGRGGLLRAGRALVPGSMVMTAAFGGRTYTRPGSGVPRVRGW
jgi:hypothetical protein